jgi:nitrogen fixation/metabolism regulation signal transduction histidine kinase
MTIERTSSTRKRVRGRIGATLVVYFIALAVVPVIVVVAVALNLVDRQMHQQVFNQLESVTQLKVNQIERYLAVAQGTLRQMTADRDQYLRMMSAAQGGGPISELAAALQDQLAAQSLFELFIYDLNGKILLHDGAPGGKVVVARLYFEPSLAGEYVQPPFYELTAGELNMVISRPLVGTTGNVVGVLAGRVSVDALNSIMTERAGLGDTGRHTW